MIKLPGLLVGKVSSLARECALGLQIGVASFLVVVIGSLIALFLNPEIGKPAVFIGILGALVGGVIFYAGYFYKTPKDGEDAKRFRYRYEDTKQPWD